MQAKIVQIAFALVTTIISVSSVQAQVQPIAIDRNLVRDDPKTYCTPLQGQAVYEGAVVTVPAGTRL